MRRRALTLTAPALALALLAGCSAGLGELCWTDEDCEAELRCSASGTYVDGDRGVCTYPDGVPDAAAPDLRQPDLAGDAAPETAPDLGADRGGEATFDLTPDTPKPDAPKPDAQQPDAQQPDAAAPDAAAPDAPKPDAAASDA